MDTNTLPAMTAADWRKAAASYRAKIASLHAQYGTGVRPGWISTDIVLAEAAAERCDKNAEAAE